MRSLRSPRRLLLHIMVATFLGTMSAAAEYRLQPGDMIEVTVQGRPELKRRTVIREDGFVPFPLIGNIEVANLSSTSVRDAIRNELIRRNIVSYPDVTVDVVEVRPLYILGDVAKPGAFAFQANYTIRHAIALAGGLEGANTRGRTFTFADTADWFAEFETQRVELLKQKARIERLQSELASKTSIDFVDVAILPNPDPLFYQIKGHEESQLTRRQKTMQNDRASYGRSIDQATRQLAALEEQQKVEDEGLRQQTADVEKIRGLNERGLAPSSRLIDEQRSILLTKARLTSTMAQVAQVRKNMEELHRQIDKAEELRQLEAVKELQDALVAAESSQIKLQAIAEKINNLSAGWQSGMMASSDRVRFIIYRKVDGKNVQVDAQAGTTLMPGDVVEVAISRPNLGTKSSLQVPTR